MSVPSEILQYIQALKWPVFAGGVVYALRGSIKKFLDNFRMDEGTAKIPGVGEVTWKKAMQEVAEKVEAIPETQELTHEDTEEVIAGWRSAQALKDAVQREAAKYEFAFERAASWDLVERLVFSDPTGAVIAAWERLGEEIYGAAYRHKANVSDRERRNFLLMAQRLGFPDDALQAIRSLRDLRNRAAHSDIRITPEDAMEYVQAVRKLLVEIERW